MPRASAPDFLKTPVTRTKNDTPGACSEYLVNIVFPGWSERQSGGRLGVSQKACRDSDPKSVPGQKACRGTALPGHTLLYGVVVLRIEADRKMPHITACAPNQDWESVGSLWAHSRFCGVGIAAEPPSSSHQKRRGCVVMAIRRPCLITPISPRQLARDADTSASRERTAPREWCLACTTLRRDAAASATADAVLCTRSGAVRQLPAAGARTICRDAVR